MRPHEMSQSLVTILDKMIESDKFPASYDKNVIPVTWSDGENTSEPLV